MPMNLYQPLFLLGLLIWGMVGCQATVDTTPTAEGNPVPLTVNREVYTIAFSELAAAPEAYEGYHLQLTGQYKPLPTLVCAENPYPSPATWGLVADGLLAYAGGYTQLRALAPTGLTMTVEGQWRHWQGPVGCGKQAAQQEIWYLAVTNVVSPSPIAQVTLTPPGNVDVIAEIDTPEATIGAETETSTPTVVTEETPTISAEETPVFTTTLSPTLPPIATAPFSLTVTIAATPAPITTPLTTTTTTPTPEEGERLETLTPTITGTINGTPVPATVTGIAGTPATAAPTSSGQATNTAVPQATATNPPGVTPTATTPPTVVDMGDIEDQFLAVENLGRNEAHDWELTITANEVLTAYVAAVQEDIVLTLLDNDGNIIVTQNNAIAGDIETLVRPISTAGTYVLRISTSNATATDYALMLRYNESYAFVLRGTLQYGDSETVSLPDNNDDFWHFAAVTGDKVTIAVAPDTTTDAFLKVYDVDAEDLSGFIDQEGTGAAEEYAFTVPADGLYSIRIGEFDFQEMRYTITLIKNQ